MDPRNAAVTEVVRPCSEFHARLRVPGDKSIAHRALIFAAIAAGDSRLDGIPDGADVAATIACLRAVGVSIEQRGNRATVPGAGLAALQTPAAPLQCANSGTTMRVLSGLLAGSRVTATLVGDASLQRRPMDRVIHPLRRMGARIWANEGRAPVRIEGTQLSGVEHELLAPSAQVQTALVVAGLHARGPTTVKDSPGLRDHTERLLRTMGAPLRRRDPDAALEVEPLRHPLRPLQLSIPGDFSSAAFLLAAAALRPQWTATIDDVGLNPTRTAFLEILREMGAEVEAAPDPSAMVEPRGRLTVRGAGLRAVSVEPPLTARMIDEIPILLVLASQAQGLTRVTGAGELRVKESDRLAIMAQGLRALGVTVREEPDSIAVEGPARLRGATVESAGDHRIAMALAVAGLAAERPVTIHDAASITVTYPEFFAALRGAAG